MIMKFQMLFTIIPRPLSAHSLSARSSRIHQSIYVLCFRCFLGGTGVVSYTFVVVESQKKREISIGMCRKQISVDFFNVYALL